MHELNEGDLGIDLQAERTANAKALRLDVLGTFEEAKKAVWLEHSGGENVVDEVGRRVRGIQS